MDVNILSRLSEWEGVDTPLAALNNIQEECISSIALQVKDRPFPSHIRQSNLVEIQQQPIKLEDSNVTQQNFAIPPSDDGTQQLSSALFPVFERMERGELVISTGQECLHWMHELEACLLDLELKPYHQYIEELKRQKEITTGLQTQVTTSLDQLSLLTQQYESVSQKSTELHTACQHLLKEQTQLNDTNQKMQENLKVFVEYEKIVHKLDSATLSVQSEAFLPLMAKINENMIYLREHPDYRESAVYHGKYKTALARGLSMIKVFVNSCIDTATRGANQSTFNVGAEAPHTTLTLFYGKFRACVPRIRHLIVEVERRQDQATEYKALLQEMEQHYLDSRRDLLTPSVKAAVSQLLTVHNRDHCGLLRAGCAFLLHVCEDETQLHAQIFGPVPDPTPDGAEIDNRPNLTSFLGKLCNVLYDHLRPLVIQVTHLETLAELTTILRVEILGQHCATYPHLIAYRRIGQQILEDVQERLVYRTSVYIRTDISGYQPSPGDLAYPEKLEMMEAIANKEEEKQYQQGFNTPRNSLGVHSRQNSTSSVASMTSMEVGSINTAKSYMSSSPADLHGMWYPPVRRTLLTLSKLYRCLEKPIFTGLAQEVLDACLDSVATAANLISSNPKKSPADGKLFEIKHLLILREQIIPFQSEFLVRETSLDFTKVKNAAMTLLNKKGEILNISSSNALLEFLLEGTPGVHEHLRDSKKEVDRRLKASCEQFIQDSVKLMLGELQQFNVKVLDFYQVRGDKSAKLSVQPWAGESNLQSIVAHTTRDIKAKVPTIQRKMQLYLANRETEFILFRPIRAQILTSFMTLITTLKAEYTQDQEVVVGCPSQEQLAAILASVSVKPLSRSRSSTAAPASREGSTTPDVQRQLSRESSMPKESLGGIEEKATLEASEEQK